MGKRDMGGDSALEITYDLQLLKRSEEKWKKSAALRAFYGDLFRQVYAYLMDGPSLELGSGIGNIKEFIPTVHTSDLVKTEYVDLACSAYDILECPASGSSGYWSNIIAVDVLHHLCRPMEFFNSAASRLSTGGRIVLSEPAATPLGKVFYGLFHHEPILPGKIKSPYVFLPDEDTGEFANMGMGKALFVDQRERVESLLGKFGLKVVEIRFRDILAYPLTGGYSQRALCPAFMTRALLSVEALAGQRILSLLGLRMVLVLEKVPQSPSSL